MVCAMKAILAAVEKTEGGQAALAHKIGTSPQVVNQWVKGRRPVPARFCPAIEAESGVRCEELLPHLVWTRDPSGVVTGYHVPLKATS